MKQCQEVYTVTGYQIGAVTLPAFATIRERRETHKAQGHAAILRRTNLITIKECPTLYCPTCQCEHWEHRKGQDR